MLKIWIQKQKEGLFHFLESKGKFWPERSYMGVRAGVNKFYQNILSNLVPVDYIIYSYILHSLILATTLLGILQSMVLYGMGQVTQFKNIINKIK